MQNWIQPSPTPGLQWRWTGLYKFTHGSREFWYLPWYLAFLMWLKHASVSWHHTQCLSKTVSLLLCPHFRVGYGSIKRCRDPSVCFISYSILPDRWWHVCVTVSNTFILKGRHGRLCPHPVAVSGGISHFAMWYSCYKWRQLIIQHESERVAQWIVLSTKNSICPCNILWIQ